MGEHSKVSSSGLGAVLGYLRAHKRVVLAVVVGVVGVVSAVNPEFPGAAIVSAVHSILGM